MSRALQILQQLETSSDSITQRVLRAIHEDAEGFDPNEPRDPTGKWTAGGFRGKPKVAQPEQPAPYGVPKEQRQTPEEKGRFEEIKRIATKPSKHSDDDLQKAKDDLLNKKGKWTQAHDTMLGNINDEQDKRTTVRVARHVDARNKINEIMRRADDAKAAAEVAWLHAPIGETPPKEPDKTPYYHELASAVAKSFDWTHHRDDIHLSDEDRNFTLNGILHHTAGVAYNTGERKGHIDIFTKHAPLQSASGVMAHEIMHQKYLRVMDKLAEERQAITDMMAISPTKVDKEVLRPDDSVRDEYKAKFPIWDRMHPRDGDGDLTALRATARGEDGITDYSREYWQGVDEDTVNPHLAINETLAEMAKLDLEGSLPRLIWYKKSKYFRPLYEAITEASKDL